MTSEHLHPKERIPGIPDSILQDAILETAGNHNDDLRKRAEEVIEEGGDALLLLSRAFSGASRDAIAAAREMMKGKPSAADTESPITDSPEV